jgi:UDP-N-acetylmuramyl pentapeptide phosphotransferase/UDP-N-acetylglucosamine-1-phosphate transferase
MPLHAFLIIALFIAMFSVLCSAFIVFSQDWHGKVSHDHNLAGVQKFHAAAVPRVGGIAIVAGMGLGLAASAVFAPAVLGHTELEYVILLLAASAPAFAAGIIEDLVKTVSIKIRLAATLLSPLLASLLLGATVKHLNLWGIDSLLTLVPIAVIVTAVAVSGGANAVNIIDGFHGLSAGVVLVMSLALGALGLQHQDGLVVLLAAMVISATLGFLVFNYPSGKLFLGDGGAYFLGFWVAEMAVLLLVRHADISAWQILAICAYPVIEVLFSIFRRKFLHGQAPGQADALHLHTLMYRRIVLKRLVPPAYRQGCGNALVSLLIVPPVALLATLAVWVGRASTVSMGLVAAATVAYVGLYMAMVRRPHLRAVATRQRPLRRRTDVAPNPVAEPDPVRQLQRG